MNKEWVDQKNKEFLEDLEKQKAAIKDFIENSPYFVDEEDRDEAKKHFEEEEWLSLHYDLKFLYFKLLRKNGKDTEKSNECQKAVEELKTEDFYIWARELKYIGNGRYGKYLDSEPIEFDGDIIITDPCYIMNHNNDVDLTNSPAWWDFVSKAKTEERDNGKGGTYTHYIQPKPEDYPDCRIKTKEDYGADNFLYELEKDCNPPKMFSPSLQAEWRAYRKAHEEWSDIPRSDWERCEYGRDMEALGITNYMIRDTIYGDWSCTTYDTNTEDAIGEFCADAGLVSVIALDEVLKYNPDFDYHLNRTWTTTWIKDFKGTVQFVVKEVVWYRDDDYIRTDGTYVWRKGDKTVDYEVEVVGHGVNKVTGEPIDFIGTQTGL